MNKVYLGNGVYASTDDVVMWAFVLTTENDTGRTTNRIVLSPEVIDALATFLKAERAKWPT